MLLGSTSSLASCSPTRWCSASVAHSLVAFKLLSAFFIHNKDTLRRLLPVDDFEDPMVVQVDNVESVLTVARVPLLSSIKRLYLLHKHTRYWVSVSDSVPHSYFTSVTHRQGITTDRRPCHQPTTLALHSLRRWSNDELMQASFSD